MIVAGFGARAHSSCAELRDALEQALQASALSLQAVGRLAAPEDKLLSMAAFAELALELGLSVQGVSDGELARQVTVTDSAFSRAARGCGQSVKLLERRQS